ncbi:MAG: hypothetical protein M1817_000902 [Caeruleum heppii]|nr:MAG: hypothetical protein M1817_000902 [Caeruleum heppii]
MPGIFAKLRMGKSAADKQLARHHGREPDVSPTATITPYRHVPTHAASDAIIGAPACYKEVDRRSIRQAGQRRSHLSPSSAYTSAGPSRAASLYGNSWCGDRAYRSGANSRQHSPRRHDSGYGNQWGSNHSVHSNHGHRASRSPTDSLESSSSSSSLEEMAKSKGKLPQVPEGAEGRPSRSRRSAPPSIRVAQLDVCEMLHDNPNRRVGQAPRHSSPLASRQASRQASPTRTPMATEVKTKRRSALGFGRRVAVKAC